MDESGHRKGVPVTVFEVQQVRDELVGAVGDDLRWRVAADPDPADNQDPIGALALDSQRPPEVMVPGDQDVAAAVVPELFRQDDHGIEGNRVSSADRFGVQCPRDRVHVGVNVGGIVGTGAALHRDHFLHRDTPSSAVTSKLPDLPWSGR